MATFKKTAKGYQAQIARKVQGKTVRKAKNFKSKREAQVWAREVEAELDKGKTEGRKDTVREVFDRYAKEVSPKKRGERWEVIRLDKIVRDTIGTKPFGEYVLAEVTVADLVAWREKRLGEVRPASVSREINLLKNVFRIAHKEWQIITTNPALDLQRPPKAERRSRRVYDHEVEAVSAALDLDREPWVTDRQITGAAFLFAIETAMRSGEILRVRNRDVKANYVHLPDTKSGKARDVPLSARAAEILDKVRGERISPDEHPFNVSDRERDTTFRSAVKRARVDNLRFHDTRHEALTRLARVLPVLDLARMTGHKNLNELLTYYEASGEELAERLRASTSNDETA